MSSVTRPCWATARSPTVRVDPRWPSACSGCSDREPTSMLVPIAIERQTGVVCFAHGRVAALIRFEQANGDPPLRGLGAAPGCGPPG